MMQYRKEKRRALCWERRRRCGLRRVGVKERTAWSVRLSVKRVKKEAWRSCMGVKMDRRDLSFMTIVYSK